MIGLTGNTWQSLQCLAANVDKQGTRAITVIDLFAFERTEANLDQLIRGVAPFVGVKPVLLPCEPMYKELSLIRVVLSSHCGDLLPALLRYLPLEHQYSPIPCHKGIGDEPKQHL